jgi:agmatine/peptidylarginine deiminase
LLASSTLESQFVWQDENAVNSSLERITPTDPPTGDVRAIAEFEPMASVIVRYPFGVPAEFIALLADESPVICIVEDSYEQSQAQSSLDAAGINNDNLTYIFAETDSYWTRDYTAWFIVDGNNEVGALNFEYNRPRPNDNLFPQAFATEFDYNYFAMNIEQTGGNFMCDGYGIAASSHIAYTENGNNETLVDNTMESFMGIDNYMVIQDPNETYIDHIDCWGKFLSVDKVLIRQVATSHSQYDELEDVADMFATTNCSWGYPYEVIRVYTPNDQPYSNSLILNDRVFVPQTGSQWDDEAIETYQQAMPGYRIFGVTNTTWNPWESTDALHCRTHEIADKDMLSILHYPIYGEVSETTITLEATINALSGQEIYADSTLVYYKTTTDTEWQSTTMTEGTNNVWTAEIGPFTAGASIQYYLHSADASGRSEDYPYVGAADPFDFSVEGQTADVAPVINFSPVTEYATGDLPLSLSCIVTDENDDLQTVELLTNVNSSNGYYMMTPSATPNMFTYDWDFSAELSDSNNVVTYKIKATDLLGNIAETEEFSLSVEITPNANNDVNAITGILNTYPNPFNSALNVSFRSKTNKQEFAIYNIKGQLVRTINSNSKSGRLSSITWDGKDSSNKKAASGIYYIIAKDGDSKYTKKVLLVK